MGWNQSEGRKQDQTANVNLFSGRGSRWQWQRLRAVFEPVMQELLGGRGEDRAGAQQVIKGRASLQVITTPMARMHVSYACTTYEMKRRATPPQEHQDFRKGLGYRFELT